MKTIRVKMDFIHNGHPFYEGEIRRVSEGDCGLFCGAGWAEDVDGEIATGEPDTSPKELEVHNVRMGVASTNVNAK